MYEPIGNNEKQKLGNNKIEFPVKRRKKNCQRDRVKSTGMRNECWQIAIHYWKYVTNINLRNIKFSKTY